MSLSDEALIRRVVERDTTAFEELHVRFEEGMRQHLLRIVRDPHAAEDLLQEVFRRVWTRTEQYHGRGPFRAWLARVATNAALNHLRSTKRRRERPLDLPADPGTTDEDDETFFPSWMVDTSALGPDVLVERIEERQALWALVDRLPEGKRQAVRAVYESELDIREAAEMLEIPEGTVRSRLHYATRALAREYSKRERGTP